MESKLSEIKIAQLRQDIADGHVDIGPFPIHERITEDTRDMRDPLALGNLLMNFKPLRTEANHHYGDDDLALSQVQDYGERRSLLQVPPYDPSETMVQTTVRTRQQELRDRAARGDKYAISMLETGQPGDSDE